MQTESAGPGGDFAILLMSDAFLHDRAATNGRKVALNNFQLGAFVCMFFLSFFFNKCNIQTLLVIIQVQTIGVRGFLPSCNLKVFVWFPNGCCAFTFEEKSFLLISIGASFLFEKYVKPLKQDNISFLLMFSFTFRLSKQSHRTAVRGVCVLNGAVFYHNYKTNKDNNHPLRCACVMFLGLFSDIIPILVIAMLTNRYKFTSKSISSTWLQRPLPFRLSVKLT